MLDVMAAHPHRADRRPRVTLYARVSSDRRKHDRQRSVTQQLTIGRRIAAGNAWNIVGEYSDNDRSASGYATQEREDWPKVEADIAAGRTDILWAIAALVVTPIAARGSSGGWVTGFIHWAHDGIGGIVAWAVTGAVT